MAAIPPPEGLTEDDYDAIHAAVVETVRGRWFLAEYARRSRVDEVQEMLAAIARLETVVTSQSLPPPLSDASLQMRLLIQRADEIAGRLQHVVEDLRDSGADPYLCDDLETQVRAVSGLPRAGSGERPAPERAAIESSSEHPRMRAAEPQAPARGAEPSAAPRIPAPVLPASPSDAGLAVPPAASAATITERLEAPPATPGLPPAAPGLPRAASLKVETARLELRPSALAAIDRLSLAEKLALFV